ncbi:uncharacterized protein K452DRAFT_350730 [Aplosporella prunicola CBS 121167]|uniref:KOW domain-containing protein n=1 Tax=Aplosporella prunicola CBS 121167 TaxID=1176127 RepID=A0A6A6BFF4_9PEZI|nr:uncharacterized protein K452DRAFT_350730 [Aplosporella prunicola CBS 121167]KAF2142298.1 hypothetical protein K452DRAFT_350730 [Aplosporella prunicola CBS 121167]
MQKVLQRTAMAKRQAARKARIAEEADRAVKRRMERRENQQIEALVRQSVKQERAWRREDYELGPLKPRRDVGDNYGLWGTVDPQRLQPVKTDPNTRLKFAPFAPGDRVAIMRGRDTGKIGEVRDVDDEAQAVHVKGLNLADVSVPEYMRDFENDPRAYRTVELRIPFADIRLVYPLPHPETNIPRDVLIERVVRRRAGVDRFGRDTYTRHVPGTSVHIPWPRAPAPAEQDTDSDTLRITSEAATFVPTLLRPPMPASVIDELRNPFSYFRDRHDAAYVERKAGEDAAVREKRLMSRQMMTPLKELHARQRIENRAKGRQELPETALAKIGRLMAAKKAQEKAARAAAA